MQVRAADTLCAKASKQASADCAYHCRLLRRARGSKTILTTTGAATLIVFAHCRAFGCHMLMNCRVLKRSDGGGLALSNFAKKQPVVLFFYPRECTQERMMRQQARQLSQQLSRLQRDQPS